MSTGPKVSPTSAVGHPVFPDIGKPVMAKGPTRDVRIPDMTWKEQIGRAIQAAVFDVFETNDIAARTLGVDASEFGKWMNGSRRPQFDLLFAYAPLQRPLVLRLAAIAGARVITKVEWPEAVSA